LEELRAAVIEKATVKKHFSPGQIAVLVTLIVVALGVYGALMAFLARPISVPTPISIEPIRGGNLELQFAHEMAQVWAEGWRSDAQLVGAVTRWQLTGDDRLTPYRPSWSFSFYSPAAGQVQTITVDQTGAQPVRQVPVSKAPMAVTADWSLTSDDLWLIFMAYGGDEFIRQHSRVDLQVRLSGQDGEHPIWYISAIAPEARQLFVIGVDALSRQVVQTS